MKFKEEIKVAAEWWANAIIKPKMDNGDARFTAILSFTGALNFPELTEGQSKLFKESISAVVSEELKQRGCANLSVDYDPNDLLREVIERSTVSSSRLPIKTSMRIEPGYVGVRHGYGAPLEILLDSKEYYEKHLDWYEGQLKNYEEDLKINPKDELALTLINAHRIKVAELKEQIKRFA